MHSTLSANSLVAANRTRIITLGTRRAAANDLPYPPILSQAGGLMSYGPNVPGLFRARRRAESTRFCAGPSPPDIPVEQPTKFDLVINLKTAKALGLTISPDVLAIAEEVIE